MLHRPVEMAAESGPSFQRFSLVLMSALPPEAVIRLKLVVMTANDPKRTLLNIWVDKKDINEA